MDFELSAAEVGPSAAEAELSTWEVVLSAAEVGVSTAKLVFSPRSKKSSSLKKQLAASEYQIVEASQSSCVATCQSASTKASPASCSGASQAISPRTHYTAEFQQIRDTQVALDLSGGDHEAYNARFSLHELHNALSSVEDTSPGEDTILYAMLQQLPNEAKSYLLRIINRIWETGVLPKGWKIAVVLAIQKPNKDPH